MKGNGSGRRRHRACPPIRAGHRDLWLREGMEREKVPQPEGGLGQRGFQHRHWAFWGHTPRAQSWAGSSRAKPAWASRMLKAPPDGAYNKAKTSQEAGKYPTLENPLRRVKSLVSDISDFESQSAWMSLSFLSCKMQIRRAPGHGKAARVR